jgi:hypothetical protein
MLICNTWIEKARLRILNTNMLGPAAGAWGVMPQTIVLSSKEHGIMLGLQQLYTACAGGVLDAQILLNGTTAHDGFFRSSTDAGANALTLQGNQQPTTVSMPPIDVPPDTEIGLRIRWGVGCAGGANVYMDLYVITYYMTDQKLPFAPGCFPGIDRPAVCP